MEQYRSVPNSELTYGNDCPYIDIVWQKGHMFVSNAVLRLIGKPGGIRFLWNAAKCSLAIEPTTIDDPNGYPVIGRTYDSYGSLFIGCTTLMDEMWTVIDWDKSLRFRIVARYNERSNIAIFEMREAIASEIQKNIHGRQKPKTNAIE